jgi:hypothetical protein
LKARATYTAAKPHPLSPSRTVTFILVTPRPSALRYCPEFGGKCNLRFDDTNPVKEDEYVDGIMKIHWLLDKTATPTLPIASMNSEFYQVDARKAMLTIVPKK